MRRRSTLILRQLGATECIDRAVVSTDALPTSEAITSLSPPLKVVYDAVGNLETAYDCVVDGGRAITVHPMAPLNREGKTVQVTRVQGYYVGPDVMSFKPTGNVQGYHAVPEHTTFGKLIIKNLPEMIEKGVVTPNRLEVLPGGLSGIPAGLERLKLGAVSGIKLVAHPQDN
ncbi:hypothetical protein CPB85DRAFT_125307 [Mucidula mucida]|nr:hypothetical protein CPB85DRAFT_125307 [Mucidula mucida]